MAAAARKCLSDEQLQNCLIVDREIDQVDADHLQHCQSCQSRIEQLTESEFLSEYRNAVSGQRKGPEFLSAPLRPGDLGAIDEFAIEHVIETGGMSIVFRGFDTSLGRAVAVKILTNQHSSDSSARFAAEVRAVAKLDHPQDYRGAYRGFYTAGQDCRLVMMDPEAADWAYNCRIWCVIRAYQALDQFDSAAEKSKADEQVRHWLSHLKSEKRFDAALAEKQITERILPEQMDVPPQIKMLMDQ